MATGNSVPSFVAKSEAHQRAHAFMENSTAKEGVDYKWALDYAKGLWEYRNKVFAGLEEKAESIVKYLGGGTGLFTLGAIAKVDPSNVAVALCSIPAVVCALVAVGLALWSKIPGPFPGLPTVENAKRYADEHPTETGAIAAFLGQWGLLCEDARLSCERKARRVELAGWTAFGALSLLLVPLAVAIVRAW
jgi:hypothetical protein